MEQWEEATAITETAINSQGSATRENERYLESYEAKINMVKNAWTEAVVALEEDVLGDALVNFTNVMIPLLNKLTSFIDKIGVLAPLVGTLGLGFVGLNKNMRNTAMSVGGNFIPALKDLGANFRNVKRVSETFTVSLAGMRGAAGAAVRSLATLGTAAATAGKFLVGAILPVLPFMALGYAISFASSKIAEHKKRQEEIEKETNKLVDSYKEHRNEIERVSDAQDEQGSSQAGLLQQYKELNGITERSSEEQEKYLKVSNRLAELIPSIVEGKDEEGNARLRNVEAIEKEIDSLSQLSVAQANEFIDGFNKDAKDVRRSIKDIESDMYDLNHGDIRARRAGVVHTMSPEDQRKELVLARELEAQERSMVDLHLQLASAVLERDGITEKLTDTQEEHIKTILDEKGYTDDAAEAIELYAGNIAELVNEYENLTSMDAAWLLQQIDDFENAGEEVDNYVEKIRSIKQILGEGFSLDGFSLSDLASFESVLNSMDNANIEEGSKEWNSYVDALEDVTPSGTDLSEVIAILTGDIAKLTTEIDEDGAAIETWEEKISGAKDSFVELAEIAKEMATAGEFDGAATLMQKDAYEALADEVAPLNGLLEKLAEGKAISATEAMELINQEEGLKDAIYEQNGAIVINNDAVRKLRDEKVKSYKDMQESVKAESIQTANGVRNNLRNYGIEIEAIHTLAEAKQRVAQLELERMQTFSRSYAEEAGILGANPLLNMHVGDRIREDIDKTKETYAGVVDSMEHMDKLMGMVEKSLGEVGTSHEKYKDAAKQQEAQLKDSTFTANEYEAALAKVNAQLDKLSSQKNQHAKHSRAYRRALQDEIKLLERQQRIMEMQAKDLERQIRSGNITQYGVNTTSTSVGLPVSGSSTSSSSSRASGSSNAATIWNFLKSKGFSDNQVAGMMGNFQLESGLNSSAVNASSGAFGIAQWLGSRKTSLQSYARSSGTGMNNLDTQLNFLWKELNSTEKRMMNWFQANPNASAASVAAAFDKIFERSEGTHIPQRQRYANDFLGRYSGSGGATVSSSPVAKNATERERDRINAQNEASRLEAERQNNVWRAELDLLGMQSSIYGVADQIQELHYGIVESHIAEFDRLQEEYSKNLSKIAYEQSFHGEQTEKWIRLEIEREKTLRKQRDIQINEIKFIKEQVKHNKDLSNAQRARLDDEILSRTNELWQMEEDILSLRIQMAEQVVETYTRALEAQRDASISAIDNLIKEIDKTVNDADFNKRLRDQQKERQEILDEMSELSLDSSDTARVRMDELNKLLQESNQQIQDMQDNREVELRKESLQNEQEEINKRYDDLINDERQLAKMRTDIVKGSVNSIRKELEKFVKSLSGSSDVLGKSFTKNLLDALKNAGLYLGGTGNYNIASFNGGGYTGNFSGGKLGILHKKESIFDEHDTINIRKAAEVAKGIFTGIKIPKIPAVQHFAGETNNEYNLTLQVENLNGTKKDANFLLNEVVKGVEKLGGKF